MNHYTIERMTKQELQTAIDWAASEGWNPGLHDLDCFYHADPNGFFAGKLDGKIIAVGSAVQYDEKFAFCGFYIVDKTYRKQGYGLKLTQARLQHVGERNAGIDGVLDMLEKYARLGYKTAHHNARYQSTQRFEEPKSKHLIPLTDVPFKHLKMFDRRHFPAERDQFLECWIHQQGLSLGYLENEQLKGYGVIRPCQNGYKIGPLFAESQEIAATLFHKLANHARGQDYFIDIPDNNPNAEHFIRSHSFKKVFETARMYLKGEPPLEKENIYGITTYELG